MRLSLFFILLTAFSFSSLVAGECQLRNEGEWISSCCSGSQGANCTFAEGKCLSKDLRSPACQATLKCLKDHKVCNECLSAWGLEFCSLGSSPLHR